MWNSEGTNPKPTPIITDKDLNTQRNSFRDIAQLISATGAEAKGCRMKCWYLDHSWNTQQQKAGCIFYVSYTLKHLVKRILFLAQIQREHSTYARASFEAVAWTVHCITSSDARFSIVPFPSFTLLDKSRWMYCLLYHVQLRLFEMHDTCSVCTLQRVILLMERATLLTTPATVFRCLMFDDCGIIFVFLMIKPYHFEI